MAKVFCDSIEKLREQQQQQQEGVKEKAKRNIKIKLKSLLNLVAGCKQCVARSALRLALFAALWRVDGQINCISDAALRFCIRNRIMPNQTADSTVQRGRGRHQGCPLCCCAFIVLAHLTEQAKFAVAEVPGRRGGAVRRGLTSMLGIVRHPPPIPLSSLSLSLILLLLLIAWRAQLTASQGCQRV